MATVTQFSDRPMKEMPQPPRQCRVCLCVLSYFSDMSRHGCATDLCAHVTSVHTNHVPLKQTEIKHCGQDIAAGGASGFACLKHYIEITLQHYHFQASKLKLKYMG